MVAINRLWASPMSMEDSDCLRASLLRDTHLPEAVPTNLVSRTWLTRVSRRLPLDARRGRWKNWPRSWMPREFCAA